ncbi:MAG: hypothetical protein GTO54_00070 [Nitrososphaeria archaeon]|nr:hypothetical protein [Nitrososphaeria archaeon]
MVTNKDKDKRRKKLLATMKIPTGGKTKKDVDNDGKKPEDDEETDDDFGIADAVPIAKKKSKKKNSIY